MAIVEADNQLVADSNQVAAVIDLEEFEEDRRDPEWRAFLEAADEHLAELERDGRNRY